MGKKIDTTISPTEWVPMKYWSMGSTMTPEQKRDKLDFLIQSRTFLYGEKKDGDLGRVVVEDGYGILQSRTISKKTGTYSDLTDKVLFMDSITRAFEDTTVLLGEIYLPVKGSTAKETGTILRCLPSKAIERQKEVPLHFYIFDCLMYNGEDLTDTPMEDRIKYLPKAAEAINSPLVEYAKYYEANEDTFYDRLGKIFEEGGEGVVLYKKTMTPCQDRTSAWETVKVKRELELDADVFITGIQEGQREYTGKMVEEWNLWQDTRTGELLNGNYYTEYSQGGCYEPVSKTYFFGLPGSIECSVFDDDGNEIVLCYCSNLTDEFRRELRDHYEKYDHVPARVSGMAISQDKNGIYSIRHPKFLGIREDYDIKDCKLSKLI